MSPKSAASREVQKIARRIRRITRKIFSYDYMGGLLPSKKREYILTTWPTYLDIDAFSTVLPKITTLKNIGFTHAGIRLYDPVDQSSKINQIRAGGSRIAFFETMGIPTRAVLCDPAQLDPATHASNGQNLKYFDGVGFDPLICHNDIACPGGVPRNWALDPKYTGTIWQQQLQFFGSIFAHARLQTYDIVCWDVEVWTVPTVATGVEYDYPEAISASAQRYTGTQAQRYLQYIEAWKARARDLVNTSKDVYKDPNVYFYAEQIPEFWEYAQSSQQVGASPPARGPSWMPPGVGAAPSPQLYLMNNPSLLATYLSEGNYTGALAWISFTYDGLNRVTTSWSSSLTNQCATLLKQAGVKGCIEYPGPHDPGFNSSYYYDHAQAFYNGFKT